MIHWKLIDEYIEPNWLKDGTDMPPWLFWRKNKGAMLGYIRDGELFDWKWVYVCDANKVTHVSEVNEPGSNVVSMETFKFGQNAGPKST